MVKGQSKMAYLILLGDIAEKDDGYSEKLDDSMGADLDRTFNLVPSSPYNVNAFFDAIELPCPASALYGAIKRKFHIGAIVTKNADVPLLVQPAVQILGIPANKMTPTGCTNCTKLCQEQATSTPASFLQPAHTTYTAVPSVPIVDCQSQLDHRAPMAQLFYVAHGNRGQPRA